MALPKHLREFDDAATTRQWLMEDTLGALQKRFPIEDEEYRLELVNPRFEPKSDYGLNRQKRALLTEEQLRIPVKGTWRLAHKATGQVLDERKDTVMHLPYLTERNTLIYGGNEYSCFHGETKISTDHGPIAIKDIVEQELEVNVLTYDFEHAEFCYQPVVNWFKYRRNANTPLLRSEFDCLVNSGYSTVWSTPTHAFYRSDGTTRPAEEPGAVTTQVDKLTHAQEQLLYGGLLGDSTIYSDLLRFSHCAAQREYLELKYAIMRPYVSGPIRQVDLASNGRTCPQFKFDTRVLYSVRKAYELCYTGRDRGRKKQVSIEWLNKIDALGLAFWYMDDGSARRLRAGTDTPVLMLCTHGFDDSGVNTLCRWLYDRWGIQTFIGKNRKLYGDKSYGSAIGICRHDSVHKFLKLVAPYIVPCMRYKLLVAPKFGVCACGAKISRNRHVCGNCLIRNSVDTQGRLSKSLRHHYPGRTSNEIRGLVAAGITPGNFDDMYLDWLEIQQLAGTELPAVRSDNTENYGLVDIPCTVSSPSSAIYATPAYVYDIEVFGTHIYFANGLLVSNSTSQQRLKPGVYSRRKKSGEIESFFNVVPGTGRSFKLWLEPETGVFKINIGQSNIPLYPLMQAMGLDAKALSTAWGPEILEANMKARAVQATDKLFERITGKDPSTELSEEARKRLLVDTVAKTGLDPEVIARTLGLKDTSTVTPELLLRATQKMLNVSRGDEEADDRDAPKFSKILSIEDFIRERIEKDAGRTARTLLWKARRDKSLKRVQVGALNPYVQGYLFGSRMAAPLEETNPMSLLEQAYRITKLGEGGIGDAEAITEEARDVNIGQLGFIDSISGPESLGVGIDVRAAYKTYKGRDGQMYAEFTDIKTGKPVYLRPEDVDGKVVAFPGEMKRKTQEVAAVKDGQVQIVPKSEVDIAVPSFAHMMSANVNLNPMPTAVQPARQFYGAKFWSQYMPQVQGEVPLVDSVLDDEDTTFSEYYGRKVGTIRSEDTGTVLKSNENKVVIRTAKGETREIELVKDFPFNRITSISYFPSVKPGDAVEPGTVLAHSNFVDPKTGALALGRNLKVAVIPARGQSYEDAIVISRDAANKMSTQRLYSFDRDNRNGINISLNKYLSMFPDKFTREQVAHLDENGVSIPGATLKFGDPIVLATGPKLLTPEDVQLGRLHKALRTAVTDKAVIWDHNYPGVVTDAAMTRHGAVVNVKAQVPLQEGDKLSTRYGLKGVCGRIIDSDKMPRDTATNEPYDMLLNPMGILSRVAPNQLIELQLGKIAKRTGKQMRLPQLPPDEGWNEWALKQLADAGIEEKETVFDPELGRNLPAVSTGMAYVLAFHHLAEKKRSERGTSGVSYTMDEQPAKGGSESQQAKKMCFPGNQKVLTIQGEVPIAEIVNSKLETLVLGCKDGIWDWHRVSGFHRRIGRKSEILVVKWQASDGRTGIIKPTINHEVYLWGKKDRIQAGKLIPGDRLLSYTETPNGRMMSEPVEVVSVRQDFSSWWPWIFLYDITVDGSHNYTVDGTLVSNSGMDMTQLLSHGAHAVIRDTQTVRGARNDEFFKALKMGRPLPEPKVPFVYNKFLNLLKAGGVNISQKGDILELMPMTDSAISQLSHGSIYTSKMLDDDLRPIGGGLFDPGLTGGAVGKFWTHVELNEPIPNPVFEEPIRRLLGLRKQDIRNIIAGRMELNGSTGGKAVKSALEALDIDKEIEKHTENIDKFSGSARDNSIKAVGYLTAAKRQGIHPSEWILTKMPVLPPVFRPVSKLGDITLEADINELYRDLIETNTAIKNLRTDLPEQAIVEEKETLYDAVAAVMGLGDPITPEGRSKRLKGAIKSVIGTSPKFSMFQGRVISKPVDMVGRTVVAPDPNLDMDSVGIPEDSAWTLYRDFVIRRLVQQNIPMHTALEMIEKRDKQAREALDDEMAYRPVILDRAPTWHKFNLLAFNPHIVSGDVMRVSPLITKGFNMDFDGDALNFHVPVLDKAVEQARSKMMPSHNLFSLTDLKSVRHSPQQEMSLGLYMLTRKPSDKTPVKFKSIGDAKRAYARGEIGANDPIIIGAG